LGTPITSNWSGPSTVHPLLDQSDGEVGHVDPDPLPPELFRRIDRRAAAAERIEHHVAGVGRGGHDPFEQGAGLLGGVAEAFLGLGVYGRDVVDDVLNGLAVGHVALELGKAGLPRASGRPVDEAIGVQEVELVLGGKVRAIG
jgi:hypothetical protein